ncbi:MAG: DUF554 domain-containing protein [Pedosphaera sp.]|nr:DUF554 domain-containing protein [Pedosphaera sp.]
MRTQWRWANHWPRRSRLELPARVIGLGTLINAAAILVGGCAGLLWHRHISLKTQQRLRLFLALLTFVAAGGMIWEGLAKTTGLVAMLKLGGVALLSLMLGALLGRALGIQNQLNKLGEYARASFAKADTASASKVGDGFVTCTLLFCVGPMAILGSVEDGLVGTIKVLALKSVMDGLATMAFAVTFGWSVMLAVIPLVAYQGTITLLARLIKPYLDKPELMQSINLTGGLLVLCIVLVVLDARKVPLADYLPAMLIAPALAQWWLC